MQLQQSGPQPPVSRKTYPNHTPDYTNTPLTSAYTCNLPTKALLFLLLSPFSSFAFPGFAWQSGGVALSGATRRVRAIQAIQAILPVLFS